MANQISLGPTGERVAYNLWKLREARGLTKTELGRAVEALGRTLNIDLITKVEARRRRVDVDDLVTLSLALQCPPNRLLLPGVADETACPLTPRAAPPAYRAWRWATGEVPLGPAGEVAAPWGDYVRYPAESRPHHQNSLTAEQIKANDHLLEPIRAAVSAAIDAGIPAVAALDAAEKEVRMRDINTALRDYVTYSSEPNDPRNPVEPGLIQDIRGTLRLENDTEGGPHGSG